MHLSSLPSPQKMPAGPGPQMAPWSRTRCLPYGLRGGTASLSMFLHQPTAWKTHAAIPAAPKGGGPAIAAERTGPIRVPGPRRLRHAPSRRPRAGTPTMAQPIPAPLPRRAGGRPGSRGLGQGRLPIGQEGTAQTKPQCPCGRGAVVTASPAGPLQAAASACTLHPRSSSTVPGPPRSPAARLTPLHLTLKWRAVQHPSPSRGGRGGSTPKYPRGGRGS